MGSKALTATEIADLIEEGKVAKRAHLRWADAHRQELLYRWRQQDATTRRSYEDEESYGSYDSPEG